MHWKDWCWSSYTLATWCDEPTHWKRPWCWERLRARGERGDRGWDGWMASLTQWTWVWANSRRQWRTGKPGVLQFMGSQKVRHDLVTEQQQIKWNVSHKKEKDITTCSNMDRPREYHTNWSKSERQTYDMHLYAEALRNDTNELIYKIEINSQN